VLERPGRLDGGRDALDGMLEIIDRIGGVAMFGDRLLR